MRKLLLSTGLIFTSSLMAQEAEKPKVWTKGSELGTNIALSGTSPNWSGGAANNLAGNVFFNSFANAKVGKNSWDNVLKINVGALSQKKADLKNNSYRETKKNIDNVFFDSKYGRAFNAPKWLGFFAGVNLQTQLLPGYNYTKDTNGRDIKGKAISSFMSSGIVMPAVGFEAKPYEWFSARLGLGAVKNTFVINQKLYENRGENVIANVEKGKILKSEIGFQINAGINRDFGKAGEDKVKPYNLKVNYLGFAPYNFANSNSPLDSRIDLGFSAKLSKYINFNYTLISIFDKDLARPGQEAWQNSWILGLGFLYKM